MPYKYVEEPIKSPEAFKDLKDEHVLSQASTLLLLGAQLETAGSSAGPTALRAHRPMSRRIPSEYLTKLNIPRLMPHTGKRIQSQEVVKALRNYSKVFVQEPEQVPPDVIYGLARRLHRQTNVAGLSPLLEACLRHPHEVVRVAAALAYFHIASDPARLLVVIEKGALSDEPLVRELALAALSHLFPDHPRLRELTQEPSPNVEGVSAHTTLLLHGTFARDESWWRPGGDFYGYLRDEGVRADLYNGQNPFEWSGAYSDAGRAIAAGNLPVWLTGHNIQRPYLITHSHGGSVAMLASQSGLEIGPLVLLSCPVHFPKYMPDFNRVRKVVSIRVKLDWVIWLDGGGQRFHHPKIEEHVLPIWFAHSATHDSDVWRTHDVPGMIPP